MLLNQFYNKTELTQLMENMTIAVDTREKKIEHITSTWDQNGIRYKIQGLNAGDYGAIIPPAPDLNIIKPIFIPVVIERKANLDELANNFKNRSTFENEFIRLKFKGYKVYMFIEDLNGYEKLIKGQYRSQYDSKAFLGSLKSFEARYNINVKFIDPKLSAHEIFKTLYYETKEFFLK